VAQGWNAGAPARRNGGCTVGRNLLLMFGRAPALPRPSHGGRGARAPSRPCTRRAGRPRSQSALHTTRSSRSSRKG